jgi:site-specific DNA recombinase
VKAAIYARKSTDQERGASSDSLSIERQLEQAQRFAVSRGWTVVRVFKDEAISGTEYVNRPGYLEMLGALADFEVLIVMEQSRLGRDTARALLAIQDIEEAGVAIWSYDGQRISVADEGDEMRATLNGLIDTQEARRASKRTRDKLVEMARAGYWTGGPVFGYSIVRVHSHNELCIDEGQAAIVRQIFEWSVAGLGINKIARRLGVERPGLRRWSAQWVRDVLVNELYVGKLAYGRSVTVRRKGQKVRIAQTDPSKIIRAERPELRIVPEALWKAAQDRKAATFATYLRGADGRLSGKPERGVLESKYLLSGMVVCGECKGAMVVWSHKGREPRYVCGTWKGRGKAGCSQSHSIRMGMLDETILEGLRKRIMTPERLEQLAKDMAAEAAGSPERVAAERIGLEGELRKARGRLERLIAAIAEGGQVATLVAAVKAEEKAVAALEDQLAALAARQETAAAWGSAAYVKKVQALLDRWHEALGGAPAVARQVLRKVLTTAIYVWPVPLKDGGWSGAWQIGCGGLFGPLTASPDRPADLSRPEAANLGRELQALVGQADETSTGGLELVSLPDAPGAPSSPGCRGRRTGPHPTWS